MVIIRGLIIFNCVQNLTKKELCESSFETQTTCGLSTCTSTNRKACYKFNIGKQYGACCLEINYLSWKDQENNYV